MPLSRVRGLMTLIPLVLVGCKTMDTVQQKVETVFAKTEERPAKPLIDSLPPSYTPSNHAIGDEGDVANQRAQGLGLVAIPDLQAYLNGLLQQIKVTARLAEAPGKVYITAASDAAAYATPDGNIYVSFGMVSAVESEDEVVALLAHEFAHVALGHHDSDLWSDYQKQIQMGFAVGAQLLSNLETGSEKGRFSRGQTKSLKTMQLAIEATDKVLHPAWKRSQEDDADRLAIDISMRMGYSFARGHKAVLERQTTLQEGIEAERQRQFMHRFAAHLEEGHLTNPGGSQRRGDSANADKTVDFVISEMKDLVLNKLSATHSDGPKRVAAGVAYHEQFYEDLPRPEPKVAPWQAIMKRPSVKGVVDNYRLANDASVALLNKDPRTALSLTQKATAKPTDNHPYTLIALAKAYEALGDVGAQAHTLQRIEKLPVPVWQFYSMRAHQELRAGRRDRAEQIMEEGYTRFGGAPTLRPQLIQFYEKSGRKDKANELVLDCSFKTPSQRDECMKAGGWIKHHSRKAPDRV